MAGEATRGAAEGDMVGAAEITGRRGVDGDGAAETSRVGGVTSMGTGLDAMIRVMGEGLRAGDAVGSEVEVGIEEEEADSRIVLANI